MLYQKIRWQIAQHFELRWWKRYLKGKNKLDYLFWKKMYWKNNILDNIEGTVNLKPTQHILDAGCGPAGIFITLSHYQVTAADPLIYAYASQLLHFSPQDYPWVKFQNKGIEQISGKEYAKKFDTIFCLNALNHVKNIELSLQNLLNALKPNGYIVLTLDAHKYNKAQKIFKTLPGDILHPHQYTLQQYQQLLLRHNTSICLCKLLKKQFLFNHYLIVVQKCT